ncbi:MAG: HNH endonuclease [Terriglobales bacterium]
MSIADQISALAQQLRLDTSLLYQEIYWALGEQRINRVTPSEQQFREWKRHKDGLMRFWEFANERLSCELSQDEIHDVWECIHLTLRTHERRIFQFQDYLMIAVRSDQCCDVCKRRPPEVKLEIDHILPSSRGGAEGPLNLRFLCEQHNRSRGNRFRWADVWRYKAMATGQST